MKTARLILPKSLFRFCLLKAHGMGLPYANELRTQILKSLQDQNAHTIVEVKESIAKRFNLSQSEREKMSPKRARPIFNSKIIQVLSQLRNDGLIVNETRGVFKITRTGLIESKKV